MSRPSVVSVVARTALLVFVWLPSLVSSPPVSVPAAAHASNVLRTCSALDAMLLGMGGRASDARSALDVFVGALDAVLAEHSALRGPGAA